MNTNTATAPAANVIEMPREPIADLPTLAPTNAALILTGDSLDRMVRFATLMASGKTTIPKHLQGSEGDCMAVTMQAMSWRMNPFSVAQKTHLVNGTLGYEAQLINAAIIGSGLLAGRPEYEWFGSWERVIGKYKEVASKHKEGEFYRKLATTLEDEKGVGVRCSATLKGESKPRVLELFLTQAGVRNSPLWADDPRQQLAYLAVKRWARLYTPDVILGVYSPDELEEIRPTAEKHMGAVEEVDRAAAVRGALAGSAPTPAAPTARPVTLDRVLLDIKAAETPEQMSAAAEACAKLVDSNEKEIARKAYSDRLKALKAAAGGPSYVEIADKINAASTRDEVNLALDLARSMRDETQRGELESLAEKRAQEFA